MFFFETSKGGAAVPSGFSMRIVRWSRQPQSVPSAERPSILKSLPGQGTVTEPSGLQRANSSPLSREMFNAKMDFGSGEIAGKKS